MIKILIKRGTATQWSASTTPLASGELGLDTTNNILKAGNGTDLWATLNQISLTSSQVDELARDAIGSALVGGSGISVNVNDAADSITVSVDNTIATKSYTDTAVSNIINSAPATLDTLNELATALGNDANFATTVTNSLAGKVSKSGGDTITASTAATIPLTIQAASSQSAFLLSWQNSSGTNLGRIDQSGNIRFSANTLSQLNAGNGSGLFIPSSATVVPLSVKGYASQTGNLQEWQNSAGNIIARITSDGGILSSTFVTGGTASPGTNLGAITAYPVNTSTVGIVVKGFTSQTADLQQWQNSAGTALTAIDSTGRITSTIGIYTNTKISIGGASWSGGSGNLNVFSTSTSNPTTVIRSVSSQTSNLTEWQTSAGAVVAYLDTNGSAFFNSNFQINGVGSVGQSPQASSQFIVKNNSATRTGLTIISDSSQTANLQEWQNSSGSILLRVASDGQFVSSQQITAQGGLDVVGGGNGLRSISGASTVVPLTVRGASSQTANLLEWQNSAGTVLGSITANGYFSGQSLELANYGTLSTINLVANEVPVYVIGAASQTADLQQWLDNGLNTVAKIDANGNFKGGLVYEINIQTGTSYTFALSDSKSVVLLNNENNITAYIPTNSIAFPIGSSITVVQSGLGQATIQALTPATTSILSNAVTAATPRLRGYGSSVTLIKVTAEQWFAVGDIY